MSHDRIRIASVSAPDFGLPRSQPAVGRAEYEARIEMARARAVQAGLDFLLVYGDREHFANLAYLTDHDPRFEEALLVIDSKGGRPDLLLGNEGLTYAELVEVDVERRLYQGFSLPGQKARRQPAAGTGPAVLRHRARPADRDRGLEVCHRHRKR